MPSAPHVEKHFEASATVRDVVIGMSDGLTVPFALAAGLTGVAAATSRLVVVAGLAEIAAGSIDRKSKRLNSSHLGISYAVFLMIEGSRRSTLFPYTTLFRSLAAGLTGVAAATSRLVVVAGLAEIAAGS